MEWIETTGKTIEEALEQALLELGVTEDELEYEIVQEPKSGFLGRLGASSAHVRARVKPVSREKPQRRRGGGRGRSDRRRPRDKRDKRDEREQQEQRERSGPRRDQQRQPSRSKQGGGSSRRRKRSSDRGGRQRGGGEQAAKQRAGKERSMTDVPIEEQAESAEEFIEGLLEQFQLEAEVRATVNADDDRVEVEVEGDDLGLLIGQGGSTMSAVRELVKTNLQRQTQGRSARVSIDVGGYAARRREALETFARELADKVLETGRAQALEPMPPPDRKVVHDAINELDGVTTVSEGEEPKRRVVIEPT